MNLALVLLSGGLDSATVLAIAQRDGFDIVTLSFDYGQRHRVELDGARELASRHDVVRHIEMPIDLVSIGGSALTDQSVDVPTTPSDGIPVTYVPARNTVFLSLALAWSEVLRVQDIYIGINCVDYSGYPDCRPEYVTAFERMANLATKSGVSGEHVQIHTPLINLNKAQIIKRGTDLGVDYSQTYSCYQPDEFKRACGMCDSCRLRSAGFETAGIDDPTLYQSSN